jgi:hypothetical protein
VIGTAVFMGDTSAWAAGCSSGSLGLLVSAIAG